jgi:type II secretory pathway pseudopilin PulG
MRRSRRHGFSLLEVLLATGILIGSAVVLMELASIGNRHAAGARDLARSQLICQTKLNEIVCGLTAAETVRPTPLDEDPNWLVWVDVLPSRQPGLVVVEVGAAHKPDRRKPSARFTLVRWIRDARSPDAQSPAPSLPPPQSPATAAPSGVARGGLLP